MSSVKQYNWGICGAGAISQSFVTSIKFAGLNVVAVAARDAERARQFAEKNSIQKHYSSYLELCEDPSIDIVYIGTIHPTHYEVATMALSHHKNVLVEKPFMMNHRETLSVCQLAQQNNLFALEAMKTRFLPIIHKMLDVIKSGEIGTVQFVQGQIGIRFDPNDKVRLYDKSHGGGGLLDIGCYLWNLAVLLFQSSDYQQLNCSSSLDQYGVDISGVLAFNYGNGRMAVLSYSLAASTPINLIISGTKGIISTIGRPHGPDGFTVKDLATGQQRSVEAEPNHSVMSLAWQALHVEECLRQGLKESPIYGLSETSKMMRDLDRLREQVGVVYEADRK